MPDRQPQTTQPGTAVSLAEKRLGWLAIAGIAAALALASAGALLIVEHFKPEYSQFAQAIGHVAITIGVVLIVRKIEEPIIEKDRAALIEEIQSKYDEILKSDLPLVASTNAIGLAQVYTSRAAASGAIEAAIRATDSKLLMVGVAFYETFSIEQNCDSIADRIDAARPAGLDGSNAQTRDVNARFLLLNPYTTPAVIRSLMESGPADARKYVQGGGAAFLSSTLYSDWRRAFRSFDNTVFRKRVRFYRRDPGMWMVVTDRRVFFEPYTLGRPPRSEGKHAFDMRLGGHMPVFEFVRASPVAQILEDHFERLWAISKDDMETLGPFYEDSQKAAEELDTRVFAIRREVLDSLVQLLTQKA